MRRMVTDVNDIELPPKLIIQAPEMPDATNTDYQPEKQ